MAKPSTARTQQTAAAASVGTSSMAPLTRMHRAGAAESWGHHLKTIKDGPAPTKGNLDLAHDDSTKMSKALVGGQRNDFQALGETSAPSCLQQQPASHRRCWASMDE